MGRGNKPVPNQIVDSSNDPKQYALIPFATDKPIEVAGVNSTIKKDTATGQNRQVVFGNLKLGNFDEEISGINLSKLFSVYGPQSFQTKKKKEKVTT